MTSSENPNLALSLSQTFVASIAQVESAVVAVKAGRRGSASGVHWRSGIIVTTEHSLKSEDEITLVLPNSSTSIATVIGRDPGTDLAVLRLQSDVSLSVPPLAKEPLQVGHLVLAVGRSMDTGVTASLGIISSLGGSWRTWQGGQIDQLIRPNLMLYPGGSGSALINPQGHVLGINTAAPRSSILTIPATTIDRVVNQLLQQGRILRGYLGVGMQAVQLPERLLQAFSLTGQGGVLIVSVEAGSPADQAGILIGDVVVALGDRRMTEIADVQQMLDPEQIGQPLAVHLIRGGQRVDLTITIAERPGRAD